MINPLERALTRKQGLCSYNEAEVSTGWAVPLHKLGNLNAEMIMHTRRALCEGGGSDQTENPPTEELPEARARLPQILPQQPSLDLSFEPLASKTVKIVLLSYII